MARIINCKVTLAIIVPAYVSAEEEDAYVADAVNELLREEQVSYAPESSLLDYEVSDQYPSTASLVGYEEGDAF